MAKRKTGGRFFEIGEQEVKPTSLICEDRPQFSFSCDGQQPARVLDHEIFTRKLEMVSTSRSGHSL
jgi:hypothetical protein